MQFQVYQTTLPFEWYQPLHELAVPRDMDVATLVRNSCQYAAAKLDTTVPVAIKSSGKKRAQWVREAVLAEYPELANIKVEPSPRGRPSLTGSAKGPMRVTLTAEQSAVWRAFSVEIGDPSPENLVRECLGIAFKAYAERKRVHNNQLKYGYVNVGTLVDGAVSQLAA